MCALCGAVGETRLDECPGPVSNSSQTKCLPHLTRVQRSGGLRKAAVCAVGARIPQRKPGFFAMGCPDGSEKRGIHKLNTICCGGVLTHPMDSGTFTTALLVSIERLSNG